MMHEVSNNSCPKLLILLQADQEKNLGHPEVGNYIGKILREKVRFKHKRQKTRSRTREKVRFKKKSKILKLVFFSLLGRDLGFQHIHIMPSLFFAEHALPGEPGRLPR